MKIQKNFDGKNLALAASVLKGMANARRLRVLCMLEGGEMCVGKMAKAVGLSQSALSQHLARLRADGLVSSRKEAQTVYYRLASPAVAAVIATLKTHFCEGEKT